MNQQHQSFEAFLASLMRELAPEGDHSHTCPDARCNTTWSHPNALKYDPNCTAEEFSRAHQCPKCGLDQYEKDRA